MNAATLRRPVASLLRASRVAYLRWRIEHAEDDVIAAGQHIEHLKKQQTVYRFAAQELRCRLAMVEAET